MDTKRVVYNNTDLRQLSGRARWRAKLEESWRPITLALVVQNKKSQSLLAYVADLARDQHRRGGRVFLTFPWDWNVLTTWPIQSVINEAPFLCAREGKKGILTNCADTSFGWSVSLLQVSRVSTSGAVLTCKPVLCPMRCVCGTFQVRKTRCAVAILSTMKRLQPFRLKRTRRRVSGDKNFLTKRDVQSVEFTTNVGHPQNSTLAKMISDAGSEEMIRCATQSCLNRAL